MQKIYNFFNYHKKKFYKIMKNFIELINEIKSLKLKKMIMLQRNFKMV